MKTAKNSAPPPAFDPQRYPRTYTFSASDRWTMVIVAAGLLVFAGWLVAARSTGTAASKHNDVAAGILLAGGFGIDDRNAASSDRGLFVSRADYEALQVGDTACLSEHPGLIGLRWAEVHSCADAPSRGNAN